MIDTVTNIVLSQIYKQVGQLEQVKLSYHVSLLLLLLFANI